MRPVLAFILTFAAVIVLILSAGTLMYVMSLEDVKPSGKPGAGTAEERLEDLGYLDFYEIPDEFLKEKGVMQSDPERYFPGVNVYQSGSDPIAYMVDMKGEVVHTWEIPGSIRKFNHIEVLPGCEVLIFRKDQDMIRLDRDSNDLMKVNSRFHHDLDVDENGDIYAISREGRAIEHDGTTVTILDDFILVMMENGTQIGKISIYDLFGKFVDGSDLDRLIGIEKEKLEENYPEDIFHTNTVEVLMRDIGTISDKGDLLVSVRNIDMIAIIDPLGERIKWSWGPGVISRQHRPTILEDGNILVFDNGMSTMASRAVIMDPLTGKIVWEYSDGFYSPKMGSAQMLPNGNVLISDARYGRAFEVTEEGDIVWEYLNHETRVKNEILERAPIHHIRRFASSDCL